MIKIAEIKTSIVGLLKKTEDIDVFFTNVSKTDSADENNKIEKYFHVALKPISTSLFGKEMRDRAFFIDVSYINDKGDENTFYEWFEKMEAIVLPIFKVANRSITVESASFKIVDNVGHFIFTLNFRDVIDFEQEGELVQDLDLKIT